LRIEICIHGLLRFEARFCFHFGGIDMQGLDVATASAHLNCPRWTYYEVVTGKQIYIQRLFEMEVNSSPAFWAANDRTCFPILHLARDIDVTADVARIESYALLRLHIRRRVHQPLVYVISFCLGVARNHTPVTNAEFIQYQLDHGLILAAMQDMNAFKSLESVDVKREISRFIFFGQGIVQEVKIMVAQRVISYNNLTGIPEKPLGVLEDAPASQRQCVVAI